MKHQHVKSITYFYLGFRNNSSFNDNNNVHGSGGQQDINKSHSQKQLATSFRKFQIMCLVQNTDKQFWED